MNQPRIDSAVVMTCVVVVGLGVWGRFSASAGQPVTSVDWPDVVGGGFLLALAACSLIALLRLRASQTTYWLIFSGVTLLCAGLLEDVLDEFRDGAMVLGSWPENVALMIGAVLTGLGLLRWSRQARANSSEYQEQALTDPLTGLGNRRSMEQALGNALSMSLASNSALSLLTLDLDHFKKVNDIHGHDCGDAVLKTFAGVMRQACRSSDLIFRSGGEEFLIVLLGADLNHARERGENIRRRLSDLYFSGAGDQKFSVTTSIGLTWLGALDDVASLRRRADQALYLAKRSGRDRIELIGPDEAHRLPMATASSVS
ncbi:MAG: GGDEF domain-containing protein [Pseudomonadota bacterium]